MFKPVYIERAVTASAVKKNVLYFLQLNNQRSNIRSFSDYDLLEFVKIFYKLRYIIISCNHGKVGQDRT